MSYPAKRFVYIIRSVNQPQKRYVGVSADVAARVSGHNAAQNKSTAPWLRWAVDVTIEFRSERIALRFEKYLKSGAGHACQFVKASAHAKCEPPVMFMQG